MSLRRHAETDEQEEALARLEQLAKEAGIPLRYGRHIGKSPQSIILDIEYQDGAVCVDQYGIVQGVAFRTEDESEDAPCEDIRIRTADDLRRVHHLSKVVNA